MSKAKEVKAEDLAVGELEGLETSPEIFVDGIQGALANEHIAKLNFFSQKIDPEKKSVRKIAVVTLVMTVADLREIQSYIDKVLGQGSTDAKVSPSDA